MPIMTILTNYSNEIITGILFFGFVLAITALVSMHKSNIKEKHKAELDSKARKVKKFE